MLIKRLNTLSKSIYLIPLKQKIFKIYPLFYSRFNSIFTPPQSSRYFLKDPNQKPEKNEKEEKGTIFFFFSVEFKKKKSQKSRKREKAN